MSLRRQAVCLGLAALLPAAAHADESLGTMTVSANRTETAVAASGSSVTVITAEEIEKKQAVTALDVIRDVPGVNLATSGGSGKTTYLSIRGFASKGILILVDGVNVADPSGNQTTYDLTNLPADNIERIEVLRGSQSTLYGSEAMGGVISITTKGGKGSGKVVTGETGIEWGSRGTAKGFVNARGESGGVYYSGGLSGLTTQGFDISRDGPNEADGNKTGAANLRLGSDLVTDVGILDRLNVEASGRYLKAKPEFDAWGTNAATDDSSTARTIEQSGKLTANVDLFDGLLANSISASQSKTRRDYYDATWGTTFYDGEITKYEYQGTLKPVEHNTLVFGADRRRDHMETNVQDSTAVTNDGIFGNYILGLLDDDLTLTAGVRHDDHESFGGNTTWRTTAAYLIPETGTRFHASYGTGFRAPSLFELYDTTWGSGNPDLKPEKSRGYDLGFEQSVLDDRVTFGSTFFNNRLKNAIVANASSSWRNENIASARVYGFENSVTAELTDELALTVNHTYTQARDNTSGRAMPNQPHHTGNARLSYDPKQVEGLDTWVATRTATWSYDNGTSSYLGGYLVWDLGASYAVTDWASVYARLENLADKTYETKGGYAAGGRAGFVGMRAKF